MNNLKQYAGLLNDEAPENHFLAYITPSERDMLVEAGGVKTPTSSGIFAYPPDNDARGQSTGSSSSSNSSGGGGDTSPGATGGEGGESGGTTTSSFSGGDNDYTTLTPSGGNTNDARLDYLTGEYLDLTLTPEQKEQFQDYRENVSESIAPSTKTSNKIISGLLSKTIFPFAGNLYNSYIDAKAMGYSVPNPFTGLFDGGSITAESIQNFQDQGGGGDNNFSNNFSNIIKQMTPDSQVNQYFDNQPTSSLSSGLETSYNNAKSNINNILGIATPSQQFGYSQAPYGSYSSTNMAGNPYKDYLTTKGLI